MDAFHPFLKLTCSISDSHVTEPTFYPGNVQAAEVLVDGSYVLQISWDPPPFETLDGRLIGGYGVTLLQGQAVIGTGSTDDNVTR